MRTMIVAFITLIAAPTPFHNLAFAASKESILYNFCPKANCEDGRYPLGGVVFDSAENLYGTTYSGGIYNCNYDYCGTAFELIPGRGKWTEKVLHRFNSDGSDGDR